MKFEYPEGATPLDVFEMDGLRLSHITTRDQLNQWEQANILQAELKNFSRKPKQILSSVFLLRLHRQMFGNVWKWAGKFRTTDKNISVPHWDVAVKVQCLCEDTEIWIRSKGNSQDEIAARFHHRLVFIHPFANGNGRHARMATDLLLVHVLDRPRFTWGENDLLQNSRTRDTYLKALRAADQRDYSQLNRFVRS